MAAKRKTKKKTREDFGAGVKFGDDDKPKDDDDKKGGEFDDHDGDDDKKGNDMDDGEPAGLDIGSFVKAITSGDIAAKDLEAVKAAIVEFLTGIGDGAEDTSAAPPAPAPAGAAMADDDKKTLSFADLSAQLMEQKAITNALRSDVDGDRAVSRRTQDVSDAVLRLEDRPNLVDLEEDFLKFHEDNGPDAFAGMVDQLAKRNPPPKDSPKGADGNPLPGATDLAMKFADLGEKAVNSAVLMEAEFHALKAGGQRSSCTLEEYVAIRMEDEGFKLPE